MPSTTAPGSPYIIGAPAFVNRAFGELFADGVPSVTALIAGSSGPASGDPAREAPLAQGSTGCLRGEVAFRLQHRRLQRGRRGGAR